MSSLLDIVPVSATVQVRGNDLAVHPLSFKTIAALLARFPAVRTIMSGNMDKLSAEQLFELGGEIPGAIVAAACGFPGNADAEDRANALTIEEQIDIIAASLKMTMPNGFGPFVDKLQTLGLKVPRTASSDGEEKTLTTSQDS